MRAPLGVDVSILYVVSMVCPVTHSRRWGKLSGVSPVVSTEYAESAPLRLGDFSVWHYVMVPSAVP